MNSAEFLDAVRAKHGLTSDYQVAKRFDIPLASISAYRTRTREMNDEACIKIADALGESSLYVIASVNAERAKCSEVRDVWDYLTKVGKNIHAASVIGFVGVLGLSASVMGDLVMNVVCILCKIRRLGRALARAGATCVQNALYPLAVLAVVIGLAGLAGLAGCAGNGIDRAYTPEPVDIHSVHPIKVRTRIRQSKFCAPHHAKHDHYDRCRR